MDKVDWITVLAAILLLAAGVIVGQGFNFEVKLSDVLSLITVAVTFFFAYRGIKHNEQQYLHSIRPILERMIHTNEYDYSYNLAVHNYGSGAALNLKCTLLKDDHELSYEQFESLIDEFLSNRNVKYAIGGPLGLTAGGDATLVSFDFESKEDFSETMKFLSEYKLVITYESIQGSSEKRTFLIYD